MIDRFIKKRFSLLLALVILLAAFLRFVNYSQRFGIAYDQAHDALVARFAVSSFSLPLVGPFSSGAPFQTSGVWYWFLMIPTFIANNLLLAPWIGTTLFCTLFVLAIALIASKIVDKKFGLITGIFAAISTSQIGQSTNLSLTALMSMPTLGSILFAYKYIKNPKNLYIFWLGFFTALAPSIHLSGVLLLVIIPVFLIVAKVKNIKAYFYLFLGLLTPLVPLIIFDLQNDFVNSQGLLNHFFYKQYEVSYEVLGRRWLTYLFVFWPTSWANIIGGNLIIAYVSIISIIITFLASIKMRKIEKIWIVIFFTLAVDIILMRYVRSPLFDSYLNFLHPAIFLTAAYAVYKALKWKWYVGFVLLVLIVGGSLVRDIGEVTYPGNSYTVKIVNEMTSILDGKYPDKKFDFYDFRYKQVDKSLPLVLYMDVSGKTDNQGIKIGIVSEVEATIAAKLYKSLGVSKGYTLLDLDSSSSAALIKSNWHPINSSYMYNNTENWNKK